MRDWNVCLSSKCGEWEMRAFTERGEEAIPAWLVSDAIELLALGIEGLSRSFYATTEDFLDAVLRSYQATQLAKRFPEADVYIELPIGYDCRLNFHVRDTNEA